MFQVKKVARAGQKRWMKKEGSKKNILVSDFTKMFARQISKVQLHRRRLKSAKNLEVGVQLFKSVTT